MNGKRAGDDVMAEVPSAKRTKKPDEDNDPTPLKNGHQENEETSDQQKNEGKDGKGRKRKRVRVRKLRQDITKQLEFYFGDANLRKDRYMKELVAGGQDGWVNLEEFLKFNKIKQLLEKKGMEVAEIAKAAKDSELLEVSDDQTKVRRNLEKFPVKEKNQEEVDECTIYVQGLQGVATVESVRCMFSEFGMVDYVSLPRRANGDHKGFGFVEFSQKTGAENACKFHNLRAGGTGFHSAGDDDRMMNSAKMESTPLIQVLSKKEWLQYKQQYLKLRKESAKLTKKFLSTFASSANVDLESNAKRNDNSNSPDVENAKDGSAANGDDSAKQDAKDVSTENAEEFNADRAKSPLFVEGCIVKIEAETPLQKIAKATLRVVPDVVYVDMMENDPVAFLRFPSAEESRKFVEGDVKLTDIVLKSKVILVGDDEKLYWERVESMRVKKRRRGREKQRGREKLQGRYEKHVASQEKKILNKRTTFDD